MQAENGIHLWILHDAVSDHRLGPTLGIGAGRHLGKSFLGGLEDELDGARNLRLHACQHFGYTHQDCGMGIVTAGMHHRTVLAHVFGDHLGREGQAGRFLHRKRVHVGAQRDDLAGQAALEKPHHAMASDTRGDVHAQLAQMIRHQLGGANFLAGKFRVLVYVTSPRHDLGLHPGYTLIQLLRGVRTHCLLGEARACIGQHRSQQAEPDCGVTGSCWHSLVSMGLSQMHCRLS
ncbi:hypothetical protein D9M71_455600 [compost metagenome]